MLATIGLLLLSLTLLFAGGEVLVRGGSRLAVGLGVSPLFIGLTLISFGTSAPELVVSVIAALRGAPDIAVGNVVGSNIVNVGFIMGLAAVIAPICLASMPVWRDLALAIVATVAVGAFALDGRLARPEAVLMLGGLVAYVVASYRHSRRAAAAGGAPSASAWPADPSGGSRALGKNTALIAGGLVSVSAGAHLAVESAVQLAELAGLTRAVVGLTIVALGTSLPELATSIVAAVRRESAIAVGNVLGSNIFNLFGILGVAGLIGPLSVAPDILRYDIPVALGFSLVCVPMMLTGRRISRFEGLLLVALCLAYCAWLLWVRGRIA